MADDFTRDLIVLSALPSDPGEAKSLADLCAKTRLSAGEIFRSLAALSSRHEIIEENEKYYKASVNR